MTTPSSVTDPPGAEPPATAPDLRPQTAALAAAPANASTATWKPLLWAALLLVALESTHALALASKHRPAYFVLSGVLTLGFSALLAGLLQLVRNARLGRAGAGGAPWPALILWASSCAWISADLATGLAFGVFGSTAILLLGRLERDRRLRGWFLPATLVTSTFAFGIIRGEWFGEKTRLDRLPGDWGTILGSGLLFAGTLVTLIWILRFAARLGERTNGWILVAAAALVCYEPALHRPDGEYRKPFPRELDASLAPAGELPNVFLLVLDTVRADHLSVYGYERETTPQLARIVRERHAAVYPQAYSNGTWTVPSHATLFTGLLPGEHGVHFDRAGKVRFEFGLTEDRATLAGVLAKSGYATLGTYANNWLNVMWGMKAGFHRYFRSHQSEPLFFVGEGLRHRLVPGLFMEVAKGGTRAATIIETMDSMVEPWRAGPRPLYVFANFGDAHGPYAPLPGYAGRFAPTSLWERPEHLSIADDQELRTHMEARYDEELVYLDERIGAFLDSLDARGVLDRSWVFITSDHGEAFAEHGVTEHGTTVFNEVVRIPLIVLPPAGVELEPCEGPVSLVDISATIAAIAGTELPGSPGRDLRGLVGAEPEGGAAIEFYGDALKALRHGQLASKPARVFVKGRFKLIAYDDTVELYDLAADPGESRDVAKELPDVVAELMPYLPEFGDVNDFGDKAENQTDMLELLEKMGYVGHD